MIWVVPVLLWIDYTIIEASLAFHNNVEKMKKEFVGKLKLDLYLNAKSYPQKIILRNMKVDNKYEKFSFGSIENIGIIGIRNDTRNRSI